MKKLLTITLTILLTACLTFPALAQTKQPRNLIDEVCKDGKQVVNPLNADGDDGRDGPQWPIKSAVSKVLVAKIIAATKGLSYTSENNFDVEPLWIEGKGALTAAHLLKAMHHAPNTPVEESNLANFFRSHTQERDWHDCEETLSSKRYRQLERLLKANLTDIRVFKVGEIERVVYVLGRSKSGDFIGVWTKVVET